MGRRNGGRVLRSIPIRLTTALLALVAAGCHAPAAGTPGVGDGAPAARAAPNGAGFLAAFERRLDVAGTRLPDVVRAAEAAARRVVDHPRALITVPYADQPSFAEEVLNRSGGLAHMLPIEDRPKMRTPDDILVFSVRSWDRDGAKAARQLAAARSNGWMTVLFASRAGMPAALKPDYLIDNGATGGTTNEAAVNSLANVLHAWLWNCEYAAALTRLGRSPAVMQSMLLPGSADHNRTVTTPDGRLALGTCATGIPARALSGIYLREVRRIATSMRSDATQEQFGRAADAIAGRLRAGHKAGVATCTHFAMGEMGLDTRTPWTPFNAVWHAKTAFAANVGPEDVLLWIGYVGVSTPLEDYGFFIGETGVGLVATFIEDAARPENNAPGALVRIDQAWTFGDAVVDVPFAPGRMAPVSGINAGLVFRMLDEAVAARLAGHGRGR